MTLAKRIIPCLDIAEGRVVKGINFVGLRDAGDPVECAARYNDQGADELAFLDITASHEKRKTLLTMVEQVAKQVFIPLTVGGGVASIADIRTLLCAGADKVSINSAAVKNPDLINEAVEAFGGQAIVVAIDAKARAPQTNAWNVYTLGGRKDMGLDALHWAKEVCARGAGEILLTSMDRDGTGIGFNTELTRAVAQSVSIPVIASGGVGELSHFAEGLKCGADAVLAAGVFHYGKYTVAQVKRYLADQGIVVRQ